MKKLNSTQLGSLVASAFVAALATAPVHADKHDKSAKKGDHYCSPGCSGQSDCKGQGNASCKGQNKCDGQGWIKADSEAACKEKSGTWKVKPTEEAAKPAKKS
jgi:uncharacterized membrane protein